LQPKFLSKEERAKLALERRTREVEEKRAKQEDERKQRDEFFRNAQSTSQLHPTGKLSIID
jgi:ATP-dependent RNA helicase DDX23/PRP28